MSEDLDISRLKSSLDLIVKKIDRNSKLYGLALIVEAYKEITAHSQPVKLRRVLKNITENKTKNFDNCSIKDIKSSLDPKNPYDNILLERLQYLDSKSDPPLFRAIFTILFAEAVTPIVKEYATKSISEGIAVGEAIVRITSIIEADGTDEALSYLNVETKMPPLTMLPSLLEGVMKKYSTENLEERFNKLLEDFYAFQEGVIVKELFEKGIESKPKIHYKGKQLGYLFPFTSIEEESALFAEKPPHYVLGRYYKTAETITCCIWPLFLGELWKIVLIHEAIEACFHTNKIGKFSLSEDTEMASFEEDGLSEMSHALKYALTIEAAKQYPELNETINIAYGTFPRGQNLCLAWYRSLKNRYPRMLLNLPFFSCSRADSAAHGFLCEILNNTLTRMGETPCFSQQNTPNPSLFMSGEILREELFIKKNISIEMVAIARCIVLVLTRVSMEKEQIVDKIFKNSRDIRRYSPENGFKKEAILQIIDKLVELSILIVSKGKYNLEF
jgi:hypothetical protein